jgi:hypothetical protein
MMSAHSQKNLMCKKALDLLLGAVLLVELLYILGLKINLPDKPSTLTPLELGEAKNIGTRAHHELSLSL